MSDQRSHSTSHMSSVLRTFTILEEVSRQQPVSLSELVQHFDYSKSTIQRTLTTLEAANWIVRNTNDSALWEVSPRALLVRPRALNGGELLSRAQGPMTWLRDQVNETIHLSMVNDNENMVLVYRVDCDQVVRTYSPIGDVSPIHATSTGKAALAFMPSATIESFINRELDKFTDMTASDPSYLMEQLETIRRVGYSINDREYRSSVCAIGAPVFDAAGQPIASICISMPHTRYTLAKGKQYGELVRKAASEISIAR